MTGSARCPGLLRSQRLAGLLVLIACLAVTEITAAEALPIPPFPFFGPLVQPGGGAFADSAPLTLAAGNEWKVVGHGVTSIGVLDFQVGHLTLISREISAYLSLGLRSAVDAGANFDIRVELVTTETANFPAASAVGVSRCITALDLDERQIAVPLQIDVPYVGGGALAPPFVDVSVKVSARMGTLADDTSCGGNPSATGIRLHYSEFSLHSLVVFLFELQPDLEPIFFLISAPPGRDDISFCFVQESTGPKFGCLMGTNDRHFHPGDHIIGSGPLTPASGWKTIGAWKDQQTDDLPPAPPGLIEVGTAPITGLKDLELFVDAASPGDVGARFDILAEVRVTSPNGGSWLSQGLIRCLGGLAHSDSEPTKVLVPFPAFPTPIPAGLPEVQVSLTLKARTGTTPADAPCGGRTNTQGLRIHFGNDHPSFFRFSAAPRVSAVLSARPTSFPNLSISQPTAKVPQSVDSSALKFSGGNAWKDVGTWSGELNVGHIEIEPAGSVRVWLGLKNSDDIGTTFDVRAVLEIATDDETVVLKGIARCVTGVTRNPAMAKEVVISLSGADELYVGGAGRVRVEKFEISTRIGTKPNDALCGGHSSAQGLRLYFGSASQPSGFSLVATSEY